MQNNNEGEQKVYFARHKYETRNVEPLFKDHRIGIHYKDSKSIRPEDYLEIDGKEYKTAESTMRRYNEILNEGAIVGAVYENHEEIMLVGKVEPRTGNEPVSVEANDKGIFKTAKLVNCKTVRLAGCPVLWAIMPRQSTLVEWKKGAKILQIIMSGKKELDREAESLGTGQLEVLCYGYMVKNRYISALLLPIGRTLRDVDIYGMDENNQLIMAQVTQSDNKKEIENKKDKLLEAAKLPAAEKKESIKSFLFARTPSKEEPQVKIIDIKEVFDELDTDGYYHKIISRMLHIEFEEGCL